MRRAGITAALAAAGLALMTALPGAGQAVDPQPPPVPTLEPAGWLALQTGAVDQFSLDTNADGTPERTQAIAEGRNCRIATDQSLMVVDGRIGSDTTDASSFASDGIGVAEKKSGTSCSQVGAPAEALTLAVNPAGARTQLGPVLAKSALLDVELKQGARILATATRGGAVVGRFELQSGASVGTTVPLPGSVTPNQVFVCQTSADSGPDAGVGDNCRWPISTPTWTGTDDGIAFDSITLAALNGSFTLEGGADGVIAGGPPAGYPQTASLFELVVPTDGQLACQATTETEPGSGAAPEVSVRRLDNADPAETCVKVPYVLSNGTGQAQFLKPLDNQRSAQFVVDVTWRVPAAGAMPLPVTSVDFESADPRSGIPLQWCPDPVFTGGVLDGIAHPLTNTAAPDLDSVLTGKQFACVGAQSSHVEDTDPDTVVVHEQIYLLGDVLFRH